MEQKKFQFRLKNLFIQIGMKFFSGHEVTKEYCDKEAVWLLIYKVDAPVYPKCLVLQYSRHFKSPSLNGYTGAIQKVLLEGG